MVGMTSFDESLHPRGQAANPGQFREKSNDAPAGTLSYDFEDDDGSILIAATKTGAADALAGRGSKSAEEVFTELVGRAPEDADAQEMTDFHEQYTTGYTTAAGKMSTTATVTEVLAAYDEANASHIGVINSPAESEADYNESYETFEDNMMGVVDDMAALLRAQQNQTPNAFHELLHDVNTMGGDEIRSLDDDTLLRLDAYLLQAASRVQAARQERGLKHPKSDDALAVDKLALVDYRNISEKEVADAWMAGVTQGKVGGVIRTKSDFYNHARDEHGEEDETVIDRAWATFTSEDGLEYHNEEGTWGGAEYLTWTNTVGEELDKAR